MIYSYINKGTVNETIEKPTGNTQTYTLTVKMESKRSPLMPSVVTVQVKKLQISPAAGISS